jgi:uncharacterized membrane protein
MSLSPAAQPVSAASRSALAKLTSNLHWFFLLFAIPQVVFLALVTPPFQTPDEPAHFDRAWQIAHLHFGPHEGGLVDTGVDQLEASVAALPHNSNARYTNADRLAAQNAAFTGELSYHSFPNTGTGALTGYIPQALAIALGRAIGVSPLRLLEFARLLNGAFALAVCWLALYWCRGGRLVMFAVLLMPMSLSLFASCGQDATLIALTCLAFAVISKNMNEGQYLTTTQAAIVILSLTVVAVGRPPYVALLLALLVPGLFKSWRTGLGFACASFAITVAWWLTAVHSSRAIAAPVAGLGLVDPKLQLANLVHYPAILIDVLSYAAQHTVEYFAGVVGFLGWLDTTMPGPYYMAMLLLLIATFLVEMGQSQRREPNVERKESNGALALGSASSRASAVILAASALGFVAVFFVEYLIWTTVGAHAIYGVQGRYFISLIIVAGAGLIRRGQPTVAYDRMTAIVIAAQLLTVVVLPKVILARYY